MTLALCFRGSKLPLKSLRAVPQDDWDTVLQLLDCKSVSVVESGPADSEIRGGKKVHRRRAVRSILLSCEASLFLTDTTFTVKTSACPGQKSLLVILDAVLDLAVPGWREKQHPSQYLSYAFMSRPGGADTSGWESEVAYLQDRFSGDKLTLGSPAKGVQHIFLANYLPKGEIRDVFATEVTLSGLDATLTEDSSPLPDFNPLQSSWRKLHGDEPRSITASPILHEHFFDPHNTYVGAGVFGHHYTTMQARSGNAASISVETSLPLTSQAKQDFVAGVEKLCAGTTLCVTEFALSPALLSGACPDISGFELVQSSRSTAHTFACAFHCFKRCPFPAHPPAFTPFSASPVTIPDDANLHEELVAELQLVEEMPASEAVPVVAGKDAREVLHQAAELCLKANEPGSDSKAVPVALLDVAVLRRRAQMWKRHLPRVAPFYAVKCNSEPAILATLWEIWQQWGYGGFDCASPAEMKLVLDLVGISAEQDILYANPCKHTSAIDFAKNAGVKRIVFDNRAELDKLAVIYPNAELILRVETDDTLTQCPLSNKFGATVNGCADLLAHARILGLKVVGVSFHVGSGCSKVGAFHSALLRAKSVWDEAERQGFEMTLLDIGGGFPGWDEPGQARFVDHAADITEVLEEHFPAKNITVVAEPGRFFAAPSEAILANVTSVAEFPDGNRYYLNDGLYGSFNCLLYDHATVPFPSLLRDGHVVELDKVGPTSPCTIFGPTCDGLDMISDKFLLPKLEVGDFLLFENMGAYTTSASTYFNGFCPAKPFIYESSIPDANIL